MNAPVTHPVQQPIPSDWKSYEDFSKGIATNRLPKTDALLGQAWRMTLGSQEWQLQFLPESSVHWRCGTEQGSDAYEAIEVAPNTYFVDMTFETRPQDAKTFIVNILTRHVLAIDCHVLGAIEAGANPRVQQQFVAGHLLGEPLVGMSSPHPTRDLIGKRTWQTYSHGHTYEHIYLNSERYCWQCLVGVQRGQGDVDLASYYKFDDKQYIFTFREFLIPVASVFFFNFESMRSTGKFLGVTSAGRIQNNPAGAFMRMAGEVAYAHTEHPI